MNFQARREDTLQRMIYLVPLYPHRRVIWHIAVQPLLKVIVLEPLPASVLAALQSLKNQMFAWKQSQGHKPCKHYILSSRNPLYNRLTVTSRPSRYRLTIRQQPIAARACGFGERDRRVIDPPPILQLSLVDFDPFSPSDVSELRWPLNVVHCALYSVPPPSSATSTGVDVTSVPDPNNSSRLSRRLMGTLVATPFIGIDPNAPLSDRENARIGSFFIFHDLSCRQNGLYKLRFTLMHVNVELAVTGGRGDVVSSVESDVFEVFSAKDFPGMRASTALTRDLKRQGANIQIKKGNESKGAKKGQKRSSTDSEESASNASDEDNRKIQHKRKKKKQ